MERSESIKNIAKALCTFQSSVGRIKKDSANLFFKSSYASLSNILDAIADPLADAGLAVCQFPSGESGLTTILMHSESGEYLLETYLMKPVKSDPQSIGSAITYQRRYALGAVLSLNICDDDDANAASTIVQKQPVTSKKQSAAIDAEVAKPTEAEPLPLTIAQKTQILLLIGNSVFSENERKKVSDKVNSYSTVSADNTIAYLKKITIERTKAAA